MKTVSLPTRIHHQNLVSRVMLKSFAFMTYVRIRNHWWKLSPYRTRNHHWNPVPRVPLTSSAPMADVRIRNHWWKPSPCRTRNHHRNLVLLLTLKSSPPIYYVRIRNHWWKLRPCRPEIITGTQFQGWRWNLQRPWPTSESEITHENRVSADRKSSPEPSSTPYSEIFNAHRLW